MPGLGLKDFLNAFGCKHVFYVHKADRGVSISTTYLLSVFQAIPVRPWSSRWTRSKVRALKYIETSMFLNWMLFLLINLIFFTHVIGKLSSKKNHMEKILDTFLLTSRRKTSLTVCGISYEWRSQPGPAAPWFSSWVYGCHLFSLCFSGLAPHLDKQVFK